MTANVISESMYSVCDDSLNEYLTIYSIVNCRNNDKAITVYGQKVVHIGRSFMQQSGIGWQICFQWGYGSTLGQAIKYLKEFYPVETEEYDVARQIDHEAAFNWWVNAVLKETL